MKEIPSDVLEDLKSRHGFKCGQVLGKGSYGIVIKVSSKERGALAAKIVPPRLSNSTEIAEWKTLKHNNLLKLLEHHFSSKGSIIFLTDLMASNVFQRLQDKNFRMDKNALNRCLGYARETMAGMLFLHSLRLCHMDLRAENVFLSFEDRAVVADFSGLCRSREKKKACPLPTCLRPPEMLAGKKKVWPRPVDLWACGLLVANLFLGKIYYDATVQNSNPGTLDAVHQYTTLFQKKDQVEKAINSVYPNCKTTKNFIKHLTNLLDKFLQYNPKRRIQISDATNHAFLISAPLISSTATLTPHGASCSSQKGAKGLFDSSEKVANLLSNNEFGVTLVRSKTQSEKKKLSKWSFYKAKFSRLRLSALPNCVKSREKVFEGEED